MDIAKKYIARRSYVVAKEIQSKSVLLNLDNGTYYTLNKVGSFIWSLIDEKKEINYLIDRITEKYAVDKDEASRDLYFLIADLHREGLIEISDEPI